MTPPGTSAWITGTRKLCSMPESVGLPVVMGEIGGETGRQVSDNPEVRTKSEACLSMPRDGGDLLQALP